MYKNGHKVVQEKKEEPVKPKPKHRQSILDTKTEESAMGSPASALKRGFTVKLLGLRNSAEPSVD
jgi:hypothetical protein